MNIIFTDIDGVLNPGWTKQWNKKSVAEYNRIVEATDAKCVVTSTWRVSRQSVRELQELFIQQGVDVEVIGFTPVLNEDRGLEIETWLHDNNECNYVIIDDNMTGIKGLYNLRNFIQPIGYIGLTAEHADQAIAYLKDI